jgi:hypothetical protein
MSNALASVFSSHPQRTVAEHAEDGLSSAALAGWLKVLASERVRSSDAAHQAGETRPTTGASGRAGASTFNGHHAVAWSTEAQHE